MKGTRVQGFTGIGVQEMQDNSTDVQTYRGIGSTGVQGVGVQE